MNTAQLQDTQGTVGGMIVREGVGRRHVEGMGRRPMGREDTLTGTSQKFLPVFRK